MFYIIKTNNVFTVKEVKEPTTDATYHDLKKEGFDVHGQFGRSDYAEIWKDFYNGVITRKELNEKLKN
jgi:hypothetical protein